MAARSLAVALVLATDNAFGLSAHLPHLPPGPLRDLVLGYVVRGAVSCTTDIALEGAAKFSRRMAAAPTSNGRGYEINGDQVFVGNAPVADVVIVSAIVTEHGATGRRLFFVDAATPGLRVHARHEFMGVRRFPNGGLTFDRVRVPRTRTLAQDSGTGLTAPGASPLAAFGLHHLIAAPSLALARLGTAWARDYATRRKADGRPLGEYDEVQRLLASSAADTFAVESLIAWATTRPAPDDSAQALLGQLSVNSMSSVAAGRVLDRTVSLLAAEGIETSRSKARRGASPVPLERAVRDATALRIAGGVDFRLDLEAGRAMLRAQTARPLGAGELLGPPGP
ncbi:acyl-CoA dehydrogenase family protein [Streptomyces sp. NPDC001388]|uniref:acyl-CoA dehydrogenase family protein n=1 Tax=Streptomyces sp. NPDC001388 TaxID=3364568 RepID=UPI003673F8DE